MLHFSEPLDPDSVHGGSVRIVSDSGRIARGRLAVDGDRVEFQPAPVLARDLGDGGYEPGTRYTVELAGFPRADGLRSEHGAPLSANLRWSFATVDVREPRAGYVFEDSSPTSGSPLILRTAVVQPLQPIRLTCEEPLDPSSLWSEDFELLPEVNFTAVGRTRGDAIPLVARLVRNAERAPYVQDAAIVELTPRDRRLAPGQYGLSVRRNLRLRDFGGHPIWVLNASYRDTLKVRVEAAVRSDSSELARHVESFVDERTRSSAAVPGVDGTARWTGTGRVEVGFPAAAGDGSDGECVLSGRLFCRDLHAARLTIPAAATLELDGSEGCIVLRSQGRLEVLGELARVDGGARPPPWEAREQLARLEGAIESARSGTRRPTVSDVLAALERCAVDATVLVSGGDLVVGGRIRSNRPLILIAGGYVRISSERQVQAPQLHYLDAGTRSLDYTDVLQNGPLNVLASACDWRLDPPDRNPLVRPLRVAVYSSSIPPQGAAARWSSEPVVHLREGQGWARVSYVGEHQPAGGARLDDVLVDDPAALIDCPTVRLLVELEVFPGGAWDPPWVDDVSLEYEPAGARRER